jgi:aminoglycoside 3-N-acetyltransferase
VKRDRPVAATSGILYVRAALRGFAREIRQAGGLRHFLGRHFEHDEILAPYFMRARAFWERRDRSRDSSTNSGALGRMLAEQPGAVVSSHPTHRFVGMGPRVAAVLREHDYRTSCFYPIKQLAAQSDFSMLLLGCVDESPGFSTVHVTQYDLGLSEKHLSRFLLRWDLNVAEGGASIVARESPGCSRSFDKFYASYESDGNLIRGEILRQKYVLIPSARRALEVERGILAKRPRFVECGRLTCDTCRLRFY